MVLPKSYGIAAGWPVASGQRVPPLLPQYLGQVATKCWFLSAKTGANKQLMSRSPHFARDNITSLQIAVANWCVLTGVETNSGGTATYTASIEYPAGTFAQIKFSNAVQSSDVADGDSLISDRVNVTIPNGAMFWVRIYCVASVAICYNAVQITGLSDTGNGQGMTFGNNVADQTLGGTVINSGTPAYCPVAIFAWTARPAFMLMGDSITWAANDTFDSTGDLGLTARSIGPSFAYINAGDFGSTAAQATIRFVKRAAFLPYVSTVISEYGRNDLSAGTGATTIETYLQIIYGLAAGKAIYQTTVTPKSTSLDGWITTIGQTTVADNAARITLNAWIRGKPSPLVGYLETSDVLETVRDSGIWNAPGYTVDGTHPTQTAFLAVQAFPSIPPSPFSP